MSTLKKALAGLGGLVSQMSLMQIQANIREKRDVRLAELSEARDQSNRASADDRAANTIASNESMNTDRIEGQKAVAGMRASSSAKPIVISEDPLTGTKKYGVYGKNGITEVPVNLMGGTAVSPEAEKAMGDWADTVVNNVTTYTGGDKGDLNNFPGGEKGAISWLAVRGAEVGKDKALAEFNGGVKTGKWSEIFGGGGSGSAPPDPAGPASPADSGTLAEDVRSVMLGGERGGDATAPAQAVTEAPQQRFPGVGQLSSPAGREANRIEAERGAQVEQGEELAGARNSRIDKRQRLIETFGLAEGASDRKIGRVIQRAAAAETKVKNALQENAIPKYSDIAEALRLAAYRQDEEQIRYYKAIQAEHYPDMDILKGV